MKVVIDTDPGIDDAIAILFALAHPGLEVEAITTVAGNVGIGVTTENVLRLLAFAGAEVPVYRGAEAPLTRPGVTEERVHGADGLGGVPLPRPRARAQQGAVDYLATTLMAHPPGALTVLALAPLTNIAILVRQAPEAAGRIGRLIAMGGAIREPGNIRGKAEFNFSNDPEAAEIVLAAGLPLTLIPLDVTRRVRADAAFLRGLKALETPRAAMVHDLIAAYFDTTSDATRPTSRPLHDPCVPLLALRPDLFGVERMALSVDCSDGDDAGVVRQGAHPVDVAMTVRSGEALELLAGALG